VRKILSFDLLALTNDLMELGVCNLVRRSIVEIRVVYEVWRVSERLKAWQSSESDVISDKFNV
jgi:hypothetical protein